MKNKNKSISVGFSKILWSVMVVLLCSVPCVAGYIMVDGTNSPYVLNSEEANYIDVFEGGTLQLMPGGYASQGLNVNPGGTIEIYGSHTWSTSDAFVNVAGSANVTLFTDSIDSVVLDTTLGPDAQIDGTTIIVDPTNGWTGKLTWDYEAATYHLNISSLSDITLEVIGGPTNNPPVAVDDIAETMVNAPVTIDVLANDSDPDPNDTLAVDSVTQGSNGSVENNGDGTVVYEPNEGFDGIDTFEYTVTDGQDTDTATVTVTVNCPANSPPTADAGPDQTVECACQSPEGTQVTLDGSGSSDPDEDSLTYLWTGSFIEGGGTVNGATPTVTLDGCLGEYVITLVVNDGELDSEEDTVTITVVDTTTPIVSCPGNLEIELQGPEDGVPVEDERIQTFLAGASATDNCDPWPDIVDDAPSIFPPGDTIVTFTATDASGNESTCQATVTVVEAAEAHIRIVPQIINRNGFLHCVLAVIRFPVGVTKEDIDMDEPLMLYPGDSPDYIEATYQWSISWYRWGKLHVCAYGFFPKDDIMAAVPENGLTDLMVVGRYADGQYYYGIDTVRIISWHWGH